MLVPGVWKNHLEEVGKGVKLNHWSVWIWFKVIPTRVTSFIWIRSFAVLRSWRIPPKGLLLFLLQYFNTIHSNFLKHPSSPLSIHQHDFAGKNKCIYRLKPLLLFLNVWDLLISREQLCKCGYSLPIKAIYIYMKTHCSVVGFNSAHIHWWPEPQDPFALMVLFGQTYQWWNLQKPPCVASGCF